jgi:hypothetical protein
VARYTYSCSSAEQWDPSVHTDASHRVVTSDGMQFCDQLLRPLVVRGASVDVDKPAVECLQVKDPAQLFIGVDIYRTETPVAEWTAGRVRTLIGRDVPASAKVGTVSVRVAADTSVPISQRKVRVQLYFGRTEVVAAAEGLATGESCYATFTVN